MRLKTKATPTCRRRSGSAASGHKPPRCPPSTRQCPGRRAPSRQTSDMLACHISRSALTHEVAPSLACHAAGTLCKFCIMQTWHQWRRPGALTWCATTLRPIGSRVRAHLPERADSICRSIRSRVTASPDAGSRCARDQAQRNGYGTQARVRAARTRCPHGDQDRRRKPEASEASAFALRRAA